MAIKNLLKEYSEKNQIYQCFEKMRFYQCKITSKNIILNKKSLLFKKI